MSNTDSNYVYLINAVKTNKYKIGVTRDIKNRIRDMQTGCPYLLRLVHACYTSQSYEVETQLHERFSNQRVILEWFEFSTDEVKEVIELLNLCHNPLEFSKVIAERLGEEFMHPFVKELSERDYALEAYCPSCGTTKLKSKGLYKGDKRYECLNSKCNKKTFTFKG